MFTTDLAANITQKFINPAHFITRENTLIDFIRSLW